MTNTSFAPADGNVAQTTRLGGLVQKVKNSRAQRVRRPWIVAFQYARGRKWRITSLTQGVPPYQPMVARLLLRFKHLPDSRIGRGGPLFVCARHLIVVRVAPTDRLNRSVVTAHIHYYPSPHAAQHPGSKGPSASAVQSVLLCCTVGRADDGVAQVRNQPANGTGTEARMQQHTTRAMVGHYVKCASIVAAAHSRQRRLPQSLSIGSKGRQTKRPIVKRNEDQKWH